MEMSMSLFIFNRKERQVSAKGADALRFHLWGCA
jgi:hypothetical protein